MPEIITSIDTMDLRPSDKATRFVDIDGDYAGLVVWLNRGWGPTAPGGGALADGRVFDNLDDAIAIVVCHALNLRWTTVGR